MVNPFQPFWGGRPAAGRITDIQCSASHEKDDDNCCDMALTDNRDETWQSGTLAPASIDLDLGRSRYVSHVKLLPYQVPTPAATTHRVLTSSNGTDWRLAREARGTTAHHQWMPDVPVGQETRYVRVETVQSPSWVAWSGIQVFGDVSEAAAGPQQ